MKQVLNVIRFELLRNLKKPSFWLASIALPIVLAVYIGICAMAGYSTGESLETASTIDDKSIAYYDAGNYIQNELYLSSDGESKQLIRLESKEEGIEAVKAGKYDIFFYIPTNFYSSELNVDIKDIEIYSRPEVASLFDNYEQHIQNFLANTAYQNVQPDDLAVIQNALSFKNIVFDSTDNHIISQSEILSDLIAPVLALVFFYILICVLGNRLVVAMTEEKENRITELLLISIKPLHLIIGKVISLMILGLLQLIILVLPIVLLYCVARNMGAIPIDFALQLSLGDILQNVILLLGAYYLFTALCVLIGVVSPSAKDANSYASIVIILVILPMLFMNIFIGNSNLALSRFFTFFPPSAPLAVMFRSVFNTITPLETWLAIIEILVVGSLLIVAATKIYCKNAIGFTSKLNFKQLLNSPRKTWKK